MKDIFLTHYYYGDRFTSFKTGLGTIIRAKGHSLETKIFLLNNSFQWLKNQDALENFDAECFELEQYSVAVKVLKDTLPSLKNLLLLIVNFDLLLENKILEIGEFIEIIKTKHPTTELILTGELQYPELENIADYVSFLNSSKD